MKALSVSGAYETPLETSPAAAESFTCYRSIFNIFRNIFICFMKALPATGS
jgi:hypothetical protein